MTAHHDGDVGGNWVEVEILEGVDEVEETSIEFDGLGGRKPSTGSMGVDVPADGSNGRESTQGFEDGRITDVAGVQDVVGAGKGNESFGSQQAVSVGENADAHSERASVMGLFHKGMRELTLGSLDDSARKPGAWIELVTKSIPDEVEGEHGEHDGDSREEDEVRSVEQVGAAIVKHGAPTWGGRGYAESEKAQGRFSKHGSGHADSGLHGDRLQDVGQDVSSEDTQIRGSKGARGFDELTLADCEDLSAHEACVADPA